MSLRINHDDGFIIEKLGGPLNPGYATLDVTFYDQKFDELQIEFSDNVMMLFLEAKDLEHWNCEDINKYYEIRLNKDKMTKIVIKSKDRIRKIEPVSNLWTTGGYGFDMSARSYIGPKEEEEMMMNRLELAFEQN